MKKILIVDDEPEIVDLVKGRLEADHYEVVTAMNGKEAIKKAREHKPDLIIMDIMMPDLSGGEAVGFLKSDAATKHIPVIFLTALTSNMPKDTEEKKINVDDQFYTAIPKSFKSGRLLFEIKKILGDG